MQDQLKLIFIDLLGNAEVIKILMHNGFTICFFKRLLVVLLLVEKCNFMVSGLSFVWFVVIKFDFLIIKAG